MLFYVNDVKTAERKIGKLLVKLYKFNVFTFF